MMAATFGPVDCNPGIARPPLYERYQNPTGSMFSLAWAEDIDLNAAAGALATVLGLAPNFYDGVDDFLLPYDCWLKRLLYRDETVAGAGQAILTADKQIGRTATQTIWRQNALTKGDNAILVHEWPGHGLFLPKDTILSLVGGQSGSGAEQHVCVIDLHSPSFQPLSMKTGQEVGELVAFMLKTGTLVASTLSGNNDILGHTAAFEDGELSFGSEGDRLQTLLGIVNGPGGAGVGLCGFKHTNGELFFLRPTVFAGDVTSYFMPLDQQWQFENTQKGAPRLVGAGQVTTSTEFQPLFVIN